MIAIKDIKSFLHEINNNDDQVQKYTSCYDFIDSNFAISYLNGISVLSGILKEVNSIDSDLGLIKTFLVISKPLKNDDAIKEDRVKLLNTYENIIKNKVK